MAEFVVEMSTRVYVITERDNFEDAAETAREFVGAPCEENRHKVETMDVTKIERVQ